MENNDASCEVGSALSLNSVGDIPVSVFKIHSSMLKRSPKGVIKKSKQLGLRGEDSLDVPQNNNTMGLYYKEDKALKSGESIEESSLISEKKREYLPSQNMPEKKSLDLFKMLINQHPSLEAPTKSQSQKFFQGEFFFRSKFIFDPTFFLTERKNIKEVKSKINTLAKAPSKRIILRLFSWFPDNASKFFSMLKFFNEYLNRQLSKQGLLNTHREFRFLWDFLIFLLTIFNLGLVPFQLSIGENNYLINNWPTISLISNVLFLFDIVIKCTTLPYSEDHELEKYTTIKKNLKEYWERGLLFDLATIFPKVISDFADLHSLITALFLLKHFEVVRYMRRMISQLLRGADMARKLSKLILWAYNFLFLSHVLCCCWIFIGNQKETSWMQALGLSTTCYLDIYINSLYWTVSSLMTATNLKVLPQDNPEILFTILVNINSLGFLCYTFLNFQDYARIERVEKRNTVSKTFRAVNNYMKKWNLEQNVQTHIQQQIGRYFEEEKEDNFENEELIKKVLPDSLREVISIKTTCRLIENSRLFENFSRLTQMKIARKMRLLEFCPGDIIFSRGQEEKERNNSIYFIVKGSVELYFEKRDSCNREYVIKNLKIADFFGEVGFFKNDSNPWSARSVGFLSVLMLSYEDFIGILKSNPSDYEKFCYLRDKFILYGDSSLINLRCYACETLSHNINECQELFPHFDRNIILVKHIYRSQQPKRKVFKRKRDFRNPSALMLLSVIRETAERMTFKTNTDIFTESSKKSARTNTYKVPSDSLVHSEEESVRSKESSDSSKKPVIKIRSNNADRFAFQFNTFKDGMTGLGYNEKQFMNSISMLSPIPDALLNEEKGTKTETLNRRGSKPLNSPEQRAFGNFFDGKKYIDDFSLSEIKENSPGMTANTIFQQNNNDLRGAFEERQFSDFIENNGGNRSTEKNQNLAEPRIFNAGNYFLRKKEDESYEIISSININNNFNNTSIGSNGPFPNSLSIGSNSPPLNIQPGQLYSPSVVDVMNLSLVQRSDRFEKNNSSLVCKYPSASLYQNDLRISQKKSQNPFLDQMSHILNDISADPRDNLFDYNMDIRWDFEHYFPEDNLPMVLKRIKVFQEGKQVKKSKKRVVQNRSQGSNSSSRFIKAKTFGAS